MFGELFSRSAYTEKRAKREGRRDGRISSWGFREKKPLPPLNQEEPPGYIMAAYNVAKEEMARIGKKWKQEEERYSREIMAARVSLRQALAAGIMELTQLTHVTNPLIYYIVMAIISASEFLLNSIVFQLFGQGRLETYVVSAAIGICLPIAAHMVGKRYHQRRNWTGLWIIVSAAILGLVFVAWLRMIYFQAAKVQDVLGMRLNTGMVTVAFLAFNLLIFTVAVFWAYDAVRENPEAERSLAQANVAEMRLATLITEKRQRRQLRLTEAEAVKHKFQRHCAIYNMNNIRARSRVESGQPAWIKNIPVPDVPLSLTGPLDEELSEEMVGGDNNESS